MYLKEIILLGLMTAASFPGFLMGQKHEYIKLREQSVGMVYGKEEHNEQFVAYVDVHDGSKKVRINAQPLKAYNCFACGLKDEDGKVIQSGPLGFTNTVQFETEAFPDGTYTLRGVVFVYHYFKEGILVATGVDVYRPNGIQVGGFSLNKKNHYISHISTSKDLKYLFYATHEEKFRYNCGPNASNSFNIVNLKSNKNWKIDSLIKIGIPFETFHISWSEDKIMIDFYRKFEKSFVVVADVSKKHLNEYTYDSEKYVVLWRDGKPSLFDSKKNIFQPLTFIGQ